MKLWFTVLASVLCIGLFAGLTPAQAPLLNSAGATPVPAKADASVDKVLDALDVQWSQWGTTSVVRPFTLTVGTASYLSTRITVTTITRL